MDLLEEIDKQFNEHFGITDKVRCKQNESESIELYTEDIADETELNGDGYDDQSASVVQSNVIRYVNTRESTVLGSGTSNSALTTATSTTDEEEVDNDDDDDDDDDDYEVDKDLNYVNSFGSSWQMKTSM